MKTLLVGSNGMTAVVPARSGRVRDWQRWTPYAAVAWSLVYSVLGIFWAVSGRGFPYAPETEFNGMAPLLGRFGPGAAWVIVILAGLPAAVVGTAMLRGVRSSALRPLFITAGILLAGVLLLLMTGLNLLVLFGYLPYAIRDLFVDAKISQAILGGWTQWTTIHQLLCLTGGFLWLAGTVSYTRRSEGACLYCGRQNASEGWNSPANAAHWGRIAVVVALVPPVFYALTRYAWALGIPLGMSQESFYRGQETGMWTSGLFLATFGLVGALLMLGLVQRWGEVFPRWMIGLAGRRVPIALAIVPASLVSVMLFVGGIGIWSALPQMAASLAANEAAGLDLLWELFIQIGSTLLFPVWSAALAVATLGYYFRRRSPCSVCGRGTSGEIDNEA